METEKILVFHVTDSSRLEEGMIKVLQGTHSDFRVPECRVASAFGEPASHLAERVWRDIFPEARLAKIEVMEMNHHLIVRAKVARPLGTFNRKAYGIRSWMFEAEKSSPPTQYT